MLVSRKIRLDISKTVSRLMRYLILVVVSQEITQSLYDDESYDELIDFCKNM